MSRLSLLVAALLLLLPVSAFSGDSSLALATCPLPLMEAAQVVTGELGKQGLTIVTHSVSEGSVLIVVERGKVRTTLNILSESPLASKIVLSGDGEVDLQGMKKRIEAALDRHSEVPEDATSAGSGKLDTLSAASVCLRGTANNGELVHFSGFAIDKSGLILSTGHDLEDMRGIVVTFSNGTEAGGSIVRRDVAKDLSLIRTDGNKMPHVVFLQETAPKLARGERIFMLNCRNQNGGKPYAGTVSNRAAVVNKQILLQVGMEIHKGSSGSAVVDSQGNLVGVVKGRLRGTTTKGFVIPTATVNSFLEQGAL